MFEFSFLENAQGLIGKTEERFTWVIAYLREIIPSSLIRSKYQSFGVMRLLYLQKRFLQEFRKELFKCWNIENEDLLSVLHRLEKVQDERQEKRAKNDKMKSRGGTYQLMP